MYCLHLLIILNRSNLLNYFVYIFMITLTLLKMLNLCLTQCSQRVYLMKLLRDQGLSEKNLYVVFQSVIISRLYSALSAEGTSKKRAN